MNIFTLDYDPYQAAVLHCDKHVVKMITESVQLLSTAVRLSGIDAGYRKTHMNHPSNIWARESLSNWLWIKALTEGLHDEWKYRYNHPESRIHKAYGVMCELPHPNIKDIGLTPFALAMPEQFRKEDPVESYRHYYAVDKKHLHVWSKRNTPDWINNW